MNKKITKSNFDKLKEILSKTKDEILFVENKPLSKITKLNINHDDLKELLSDIAIRCFIICNQQCIIGPETLTRSLGYSTIKTYKYKFNNIRYKLQKCTEWGISKFDRTPFMLISKGYRNFGKDYYIKPCNMDTIQFIKLYRKIGELY